jgi:hypothetical protein
MDSGEDLATYTAKVESDLVVLATTSDLTFMINNEWHRPGIDLTGYR